MLARITPRAVTGLCAIICGCVSSRRPRRLQHRGSGIGRTSRIASSGTSRTSFRTGTAWQAAYDELETKIAAYAALQGTLAKGADQLAGGAASCRDDIGQLTYKVWYFASLKYDEDQRDNEINARRQQVQILFAKASQASAWFNPELLQIPLPTVQQWMDENAELAVYRFAIEDLYRQQEHVLDEKGEHLLSLSSRFSSAPNDAYAALSTADVKHPTVRLSTGTEVTLTYGQYRAILATNRNQADRAAAFAAYHKLYRSERQHLRVALQRRAAARLVPSRRRAATGRRSTRRCTATTFRPRSSRT